MIPKVEAVISALQQPDYSPEVNARIREGVLAVHHHPDLQSGKRAALTRQWVTPMLVFSITQGKFLHAPIVDYTHELIEFFQQACLEDVTEDRDGTVVFHLDAKTFPNIAETIFDNEAGLLGAIIVRFHDHARYFWKS